MIPHGKRTRVFWVKVVYLTGHLTPISSPLDIHSGNYIMFCTTAAASHIVVSDQTLSVPSGNDFKGKVSRTANSSTVAALY